LSIAYTETSVRMRVSRYASHDENPLLLLLLTTLLILGLGCLGLLSPHTTGTASTERRGESKVNVLLGVETDDEGRNVDDLLADAMIMLESVRY